MHLTERQQAMLDRIEADPAALNHFNVLCAALEAVLDGVSEDPEKTDPFGLPPFPESEPPPLPARALSVALAWLGTLAEAVEMEDGTISSAAFDEDGIPIHVDSRPLFEAARDCGFTAGHLRIALRSVRAGSRTAPRRAMKILARFGTLRPPKRKRLLRRWALSRIKTLDASFAGNLDRGEIARAKAGNLYYTLIERRDGYVAGRARKVAPEKKTDEDGGGLDVITEVDIDLIDGFDVPLLPCPEAQQIALSHFASFLDAEGYTYQRLVHRPTV